MISDELTIKQRPLYDHFATAARAELTRHMRRERRHDPRYEMPAKEAERFLRNTEHELRMQAFQKAVEPFIAAKFRIFNLNLSHSPRPEWIRKALADYDCIIAQVAEQHGLRISQDNSQ